MSGMFSRTGAVQIFDDLGGWHPDENRRKWGVGSCFEIEGQYLYRTVREIKPDVIVEVGRWQGCSAAHLALGCKHNGKGKVFSVDIASGMGWLIPKDLLPWIEFVNVNVFETDGAKVTGGRPIDLLLEDGMHTPGFTRHVLQKFPVRSGGRVICHDFKHWDCKCVAQESVEVLGEPTEVFFEPPSDCGYGVWRR